MNVCVGFVCTMERSLKWAATGRVTLPIREGFRGAATASQLPDTEK